MALDFCREVPCWTPRMRPWGALGERPSSFSQHKTAASLEASGSTSRPARKQGLPCLKKQGLSCTQVQGWARFRRNAMVMPAFRRGCERFSSSAPAATYSYLVLASRIEILGHSGPKKTPYISKA